MTKAYYNEHDPYAAQWLRNLIDAGEIAPGDVDERSIEDVVPNDVRGYTQRHWFAGIGGWSLALRRAGFPDDRPIDTASCPCTPFSTAGKRNGFADERHLWPAMHHIIYSLRPELVIGEQVASNDGLTWLDLVQTDMEGTGYTFRAADLCAAGVGAPHIRQRLYWSGVIHDAASQGRCGWKPSRDDGHPQSGGSSAPRELGHANSAGWQQGIAASETAGHGATGVVRVVADPFNTEQTQSSDRQREAEDERSAHSGSVIILGDTMRRRRQTPIDLAGSQQTGEPQSRHEPLHAVRSSQTNGFWCDADRLFCRDGKWRPVEPGTFPLAPGLPRRMGSIVPWLRGLVDLGAARRNRVGRLRGYGNAINIDVAVAFIRNVM